MKIDFASILRQASDRAVVEFMEFKKTSDSFADALELMRSPGRAVKIPERADLKYALCSAVAYYVWRGV